MTAEKKLTREQIIHDGVGNGLNDLVGGFFFMVPMKTILNHMEDCDDCTKKFVDMDAHSGHPFGIFLSGKKKD